MKKVTKYAVLVGVLMTLGVAVSSVYAQADDNSSPQFPFISAIAEKLNLDVEVVEDAFEEVRNEHRAQMQAERAEKIAEAAENGLISERQLEILDALEDIRQDGALGNGLKGKGRDLSEEEREAMREQMRQERQAEILELLNEKGLEVTAEELEELRELMRELDIAGPKPMGGMRGGRRNK